jgi:hypothetical protein
LEIKDVASILPLRSRAYQDTLLERPELADLISRHYVWSDDSGKVLAALRIGYDRFEDHLPADLLPAWLQANLTLGLMIASRFFITDGKSANGLFIARRFFESIWAAELEHGARIITCQVRMQLIAFYLRLGFCYVTDTGHFDDRKRACCIMATVASTATGSPFSGLFAAIERPFDYSQYTESGYLRWGNIGQIRNQLNLELAHAYSIQHSRSS